MDKVVLISTSTFAEFDKQPLDLIKEKGLQYRLNPYKRKLTASEVISLGKDIIAMIAGTEPLNEQVLGNLHKLKVISRCGSGSDNIDLESARKRGIKVYVTPDGPTRAVAELTIGLILNLLRKINPMDRMLRSGKWQKETGNLLYGKKVGIIGLGRIGEKVGELLCGFGVDLAYYDKRPKKCTINCASKGFKEIIGWADILTLHLSADSAAGPVIGKRELRMMKKGSWLVNLSRGGVIDEEALYHVLKERHLSGAAMDVFKQEPYLGPLRELDNVLLTPHIGSYAQEARVKMEIEAARNLLKGLEGLD